MEVPGELVARNLRRHHFEQAASRASGAGANSVAQRNLVAAHRIQLARDHRHLFRRDRAFVRATEHAGHVTAHGNAVLLRRFHDRCEARQAFADRAVDVALREGFGGRGEHRDFLDPGSYGVFEAAQVRRQCTVGHAGFALDLREHLGRTGHLRYPFGRNETADFYIAKAGGAERIDQLHLVGDADRLGFVLQAIARADFDQAYLGGEGHDG
ncbi:hypothetical protein D3C87_1121150 [compost metagenome]